MKVQLSAASALVLLNDAPVVMAAAEVGIAVFLDHHICLSTHLNILTHKSKHTNLSNQPALSVVVLISENKFKTKKNMTRWTNN